jgi:hypothetical protein
LNLPNGDLTWEDIARPENMSKSEISLDSSAIMHSKSQAVPVGGRIGTSQQKMESNHIIKRPGAGTGGGQNQVASAISDH